MTRLDGKVAIVTGAASGIGEATARRFAAEGARVVVADIDTENGERVAAAIRADGGEAVAVTADVSDEPQVARLIATADERFGRLDVLHNNAVAKQQVRIEQSLDLTELPLEVWEQTMAVNLRGTMLCCKHAIPLIARSGGGSIVNTSSVVSNAPLPVQPSYASSKGGINSLTKSVATTFGPQGIRCNAILPGFIVTPATEGSYDERYVEAVLRHTPLRRLGATADIAALAVFLASDESSYLTGQLIAVDGGLTTPIALYGLEESH